LRKGAGDLSAAKTLAEAIAAQGLKLDAVFITAGIVKVLPIGGVDEALWRQTFEINVKGAYFAIQALLPLFNPGTSIPSGSTVLMEEE